MKRIDDMTPEEADARVDAGVNERDTDACQAELPPEQRGEEDA